jgi:hypothetical protein
MYGPNLVGLPLPLTPGVVIDSRIRRVVTIFDKPGSIGPDRVVRRQVDPRSCETRIATG